jgi:hypothetical protein
LKHKKFHMNNISHPSCDDNKDDDGDDDKKRKGNVELNKNIFDMSTMFKRSLMKYKKSIIGLFIFFQFKTNLFI